MFTLSENPYLSLRNPYLSRGGSSRIREDYTPMLSFSRFQCLETEDSLRIVPGRGRDRHLEIWSDLDVSHHAVSVMESHRAPSAVETSQDFLVFT